MARDIVTEVVLYRSPDKWMGSSNPLPELTPYNAIHPVVSNEEAVMADTRLKAVATAERPRTLFAGSAESAVAGQPAGHPNCSAVAAVTVAVASSSGCANRDPIDPILPYPVSAHISLLLRPSSVRAGTALCVGVPRRPRLLRTGLSRRRHAQALGALRADALQVRVAYVVEKVSMGADRDFFSVETC